MYIKEIQSQIKVILKKIAIFFLKKNTTCIKTRVNNLQSCDCHFVYQLLEN